MEIKELLQVGDYPFRRITSKNTLNYYFMHLWKEFEQLTGYEHEPLAYKEYRECIISSRQRHDSFKDHFFLKGLNRKYEIPLIQNCLYCRFDIESLVNSVRRRKLDGDGEKQYDVLVFTSRPTTDKVLLWEEFYPSFMYKELYPFVFDTSPARFCSVLSDNFCLFVKHHFISHIDAAGKSYGRGLNGHLENFSKKLGLPMPDD